MAAKDNLTKAANITTSVREIDFVSRFTRNWDALRDIMGIMRPIRKAPGTKLVSSVASVTLQSGAVAEGDEIPYSLATVEPVAFEDINIEKYAKAVSIEAVAKYGAAVAIEKTDDAFLIELQNNVLARFYTFLNTGSLTSSETTWQKALAMAKGNVLDKFNKMRKTVTEVVGFVNVLDFYEYLGAAEVTVQTQFGLTYVKNFMGYGTLFLLSAPDIARGKVIAVPVENIDLYYIDPSDSEFAQLGLDYTVDGETNLIGFHAEGNYSHAVGESYALMGLKLWAEYLDGIAVVTVNANPLSGVTVSPASAADYWGTPTSSMQEDIAVAGNAITGKLKKLESGQLVTDWGAGYFIALKFDDFASGLTYADCQVGLVPTQGAGFQTLDSDKDGVFKITDKNRQQLVVKQAKNGATSIQTFDLSGLTLA